MHPAAISIHAPREGGDREPNKPTVFTLQISIHAPREGGDNNNTIAMNKLYEFQSTPPARGATELQSTSGSATCISIHAPREGGDSAP